MRCAQPAKKGGAWETAGQEKRVAAALRARGNPRFERIGKVRRVENHPRESGAAKSCREPPRGGFVGRMPKGGEMRFGNANSVFAVREITCPRRITPARRRPDEPRSHYSARLKFINALIKGEGSTLTDERIEVLSHCYSNVKYLANVYNDQVMHLLTKYDPELVV